MKRFLNVLRQSLLLAVLLFSLALFAPTPALAAADTFTVVVDYPIDFSAYTPCANGASELVALTGTEHDVIHVTMDNHSGFHATLQSNFQNVTGAGQDSGLIYRVTGAQISTINGMVGFEATSAETVNLTAPGPNNNMQLHYDDHITVHPDGTVTSYHDHFRMECK